jgi:hypothetical protein
MIYFHTFKNPGLVIDIVQDIRKCALHRSPNPPTRTAGATLLSPDTVRKVRVKARCEN